MSEYLLLLVVFGLGLLIGYNMRNARAEQKEQLLFDQVNEQVKNDLAKHKNLNKSLQDDVTFLRNKLNKLK